MVLYFIFAGEASGDLHGSLLIQAMKAKTGNSSPFCGVGGPCMRAEGIACLIPMECFQVMGFSDVVQSLPSLWKLFWQIRDLIIKEAPSCVILIDYPGFTLRLAKALRKSGYKGKIVQYICPTVWAHGKGRIDTLATNYDLLLSIYPFEQNFFAHTSLPVVYVGHPLKHSIQMQAPKLDWRKKAFVPPDRELIALFPGSRPGEIKRHLLGQLQAAALFKQEHPEYAFVIPCIEGIMPEFFLDQISRSSLQLNKDIFLISSAYRYDLMRECRTALAKSGTVTLELALYEVPTVVHYDLSLLNYLFAKYILRLALPHYCIVNILAGYSVFPELIGRNILPEDLTKELLSLSEDGAVREKAENGCREVKQLLGNMPSHELAAEAICELIK